MDINQIAFKVLKSMACVNHLYESTIDDAIRYTLHKLDIKLESDDFEQVRIKIKACLIVLGFLT